MKYVNSRKKLDQIRNQDQTNQNDLDKINKDTSALRLTIEKLQNINNISKNYYIYDSDWVTPNTIEFDLFAAGAVQRNYYYEWRINLPEMPISYLPFINVEILYQINTVGNASIDLEKFHRGHFYQVEEIDGEDIAKGLILVAGMSFADIADYFPLQIKLIVTIQNPNRII